MPKYRITKPRYINGEYVPADPQHPAIVEVPKGAKVDAGMEAVDQDGGAEVAKLKSHFAQSSKTPAPTAAKHMGKRAADGEPV